MDLGPDATIGLALGMAGIALANAGLMAWLWRFPMRPDPTGRDPHGVSTAPRSFTRLHRALGYLFLLAGAALLLEMLPRVSEYREASAVAVAHGALGLLAAALLGAKIAVIRRFRRFGHRLPWLGGSLAAATLLLVAIAVPPAWRLLRPSGPLPPSLAEGRDAVEARCLQCHGASTVAFEREDARKWERIVREMQEEAAGTPGKRPISDRERGAAAAYLSTVLGEDGVRTEDDRDDGKGRRRRGRER